MTSVINAIHNCHFKNFSAFLAFTFQYHVRKVSWNLVQVTTLYVVYNNMGNAYFPVHKLSYSKTSVLKIKELGWWMSFAALHNFLQD